MDASCRRMALACLLVASLIPSVAAAQASASQSDMRWYDAYQAGVRAVQQRDWANAERLLLQAQKTGPGPGRRVYAYGDSYIAFLPAYYLGVVYLNTNRAQQAETAFAAVRSQGLIGTGDPEYAAFERQGREATFNRAFVAAQQAVQRDEFAQASSLLETARAANIDNAKVTALSNELQQRVAQAQTPKQTPQQTVPQTTQAAPPSTPAPAPVQPPQSPVQQPVDTVAANTPKPAPVNVPAKPTSVTPGNNTFADAGVIVPGQRALQEGLLAFFRGDYGGAIPQLEAATERPESAARARFFLACAKAGLVLTGGAPAALLREAQADFRNAGPPPSADRQFVSPRLLEQLERQ